MRILDKRDRFARSVRYDGPADVDRINTFVRHHAVKPRGARRLIHRGNVVVEHMKIAVHDRPLRFDRVRCSVSHLDITTTGSFAIVVREGEECVLHSCSIRRIAA